eukprot:14920582-Alexandrium_andersonii.AAC.1
MPGRECKVAITSEAQSSEPEARFVARRVWLQERSPQGYAHDSVEQWLAALSWPEVADRVHIGWSVRVSSSGFNLLPAD